MNDNVALIRKAYELMNAHKEDDLAALYVDEPKFSDVPLGEFHSDKTAIKKLWTDTWASIEGFTMEPGLIVADENSGAAEFTMTGTHVGGFPGLASGTGKSFTLKGASVVRIVDGKIAEWADYWSVGDMERQIGVKFEF